MTETKSTDRTVREWTVEPHRPQNGNPFIVRARDHVVAVVMAGTDPDETEDLRVAQVIAASPRLTRAALAIVARLTSVEDTQNSSGAGTYGSGAGHPLRGVTISVAELRELRRALPEAAWDSNPIIKPVWSTPDGPEVVSMLVPAGKRAWNPASTKPGSAISGPKRVRYQRHADGGIDVTTDDV